jgi:hypothetical protein
MFKFQRSCLVFGPLLESKYRQTGTKWKKKDDQAFLQFIVPSQAFLIINDVFYLQRKKGKGFYFRVVKGLNLFRHE